MPSSYPMPPASQAPPWAHTPIPGGPGAGRDIQRWSYPNPNPRAGTDIQYFPPIGPGALQPPGFTPEPAPPLFPQPMPYEAGPGPMTTPPPLRPMAPPTTQPMRYAPPIGNKIDPNQSLLQPPQTTLPTLHNAIQPPPWVRHMNQLRRRQAY